MTQPTTTLPCIICHKNLENVTGTTDADGNPTSNQPIYGTAFTSNGHYGSMFDPMRGGIFLEINICDDCLTREGETGNIYIGRIPNTRPTVTYKNYDPKEYYGD